MSPADWVKLVAGIGLPLAAVAYVLLMPEKAQMVAGWIWSGVAKVFRGVDKTAVALRVQGQINDARAHLLREAPENLIEGKLKIHWNDAESANAIVRDGEVVVFMRRSEHHEQNVAQALMAYLPRAVVPRARRYVDPTTMRAADLTLAKAVLGSAENVPGALDAFYDDHLDPERKDDPELRDRVLKMDEIDLHGWLLRVLLPEFRALGDQLHPGEPSEYCVADAQGFADWLHGLAARAPGDDSMPLAYEGAYFRVALVLVANKYKLQEHGIEPYRKQAKRLLYDGRYDSVYLMARDDNIPAVKAILERLSTDGWIADATCHEYGLRADFKKRKLHRDRGVVACLHRRSVVPKTGQEAELMGIEVDRFVPAHLDGAASSPQLRLVDQSARREEPLVPFDLGDLAPRRGRRFLRRRNADPDGEQEPAQAGSAPGSDGDPQT